VKRDIIFWEEILKKQKFRRCAGKTKDVIENMRKLCIFGMAYTGGKSGFLRRGVTLHQIA
jgi:hypothetical protein